MIINIGIEIETCIQKHGQRIQPSFIQNQSLFVIGGVMEEAPPIDRADGDPGHVSIPQHIIDIVESEDSSKELLK